MTLAALLTTLKEAGLRVSLDEDEIVLRGKVKELTPSLRETVRQCKQELMKHLRQHDTPKGDEMQSVSVLGDDFTDLLTAADIDLLPTGRITLENTVESFSEITNMKAFVRASHDRYLKARSTGRTADADKERFDLLLCRAAWQALSMTEAVPVAVLKN